MKKLITFNSLAVFIFLLLSLNIDDIRAFSPDWIIISMLAPIAAGLITALIQNKNRSYDYLPAILAGSVFFSFVSVFFYNLILYLILNPSIHFSIHTSLLYRNGPDTTLTLAVAYLIGGLLGIAIKGVNQVFFPSKKFKLDLKISFLKSFLLGAIILLGTNIYYVLLSIPPDGRWKLEIPVTSFFIILYLAIFFLVSKKLTKNPQKNYLLWAYNTFLSLVFISNATAVQVAFQDVGWHYVRFIATAPYIIILGLGIICYILLVLYLSKESLFKKILATVGAIAVIGLAGATFWFAGQLTSLKTYNNFGTGIITTYQQCADAGFSVIRHYPDQCQTPDGRIFVNENPPSESELAQTAQAIRTFMGDQNLEFKYISQNSHPTNFAILSNVKEIGGGGGFSADTPPEWDRPVYIFQQKNFINDRCEVYQYQVTIKTNQVVEIGIVYPEEFQQGDPITMQEKRRAQCSNYGSLEIPLKTKDQIEQAMFAYLSKDPEHTKFLLRSDIQLKYISSKKGAANPAANEWKWEDKSYKLPEGLMGDPSPYPTMRIILSSGGKLIYYLNTTELFTN
ncbi:MAG: hypothetical protein WC349_04310 [Patescibacteria group bacterium]|jgi:hypothetical protein